MRNPASPFTDPGQVRGSLYASADRLARRTSALHRARISGRHAAEVIADLATETIMTSTPVIADIGCGRGTTTCLLVGRLPQARIIAIDLSAALLTTTRSRLPAAVRSGTARADFHRLPLRDGVCDLAVKTSYKALTAKIARFRAVTDRNRHRARKSKCTAFPRTSLATGASRRSARNVVACRCRHCPLSSFALAGAMLVVLAANCCGQAQDAVPVLGARTAWQDRARGSTSPLIRTRARHGLAPCSGAFRRGRGRAPDGDRIRSASRLHAFFLASGPERGGALECRPHTAVDH